MHLKYQLHDIIWNFKMHCSLYNVHCLTLHYTIQCKCLNILSLYNIYLDSVNSLGIDVLYLQERVYPDCDIIETIDSGEIVVNKAHLGFL